MQIVWFKRDLRVEDHRPLADAARAGAVLPLYIIEPDLWRAPDASARHYEFITECLQALRADLHQLGQPLVVRVGRVVDVLQEIHDTHAVAALWSHEETGNALTYARDKNVAAWCRENGIDWHEIQNHGVERRLKSRNGWADRWRKHMREPVARPPALAPVDLEAGLIPTAFELGLEADPCPHRQIGGRAQGLERLETFLAERGETYRQAMSSPLSGETACSRLSPHLAWGTLSMREIVQATWARQQALKAAAPPSKLWRGAMSSFSGRLHWHCHFIQKLEDEPRIEFENFHRGYDGMRPAAPDQTRLAAWANGETGLPFVDACMRSLSATGWLNFRMRAMVMATASYHLWLDWRAPGEVLARFFTDYEPGIHWSQVQMQSGTTGINTVRIYNPVKQGYDQDPTGEFTRRWVPELAHLDQKHIHEPWKAPDAHNVIGTRYPERVVDHLEAAKTARQKVWAVRRGPAYRSEATTIQEKHGSRRSGIAHRGAPRPNATADQLALPLKDAR
ncbi:MAG: FAD-binding domain-containing protein [Pseudomonadota bacterium]